MPSAVHFESTRIDNVGAWLSTLVNRWQSPWPFGHVGTFCGILLFVCPSDATLFALLRSRAAKDLVELLGRCPTFASVRFVLHADCTRLTQQVSDRRRQVGSGGGEQSELAPGVERSWVAAGRLDRVVRLHLFTISPASVMPIVTPDLLFFFHHRIGSSARSSCGGT